MGGGGGEMLPLYDMVQVPGGEEDPLLPARVGVDAVRLTQQQTLKGRVSQKKVWFFIICVVALGLTFVRSSINKLGLFKFVVLSI